jgi:hypothetical protein
VLNVSESFLDGIIDRICNGLCKLLLPRLEATMKVRQWPEWMDMQSAGDYIGKQYKTAWTFFDQHQKELPQRMLGDKPYIRRSDIDKFMLNRPVK